MAAPGMYKYEIVKKIGQGSFGTALLCRVKATGERVVIKQVGLQGLPPKEMEATQRESHILSALHHPGIIRCVLSPRIRRQSCRRRNQVLRWRPHF